MREASMWIADVHREDGKAVRGARRGKPEYSESVAKGERARQGAIALRLPTGYSA